MATWAIFMKEGSRLLFYQGKPFNISKTWKQNRFVENVWLPKSLIKLYLRK
jgi:hypothetical protein